MAESNQLKFESIRELRKVPDKEKELARAVWRRVAQEYETYSVLVYKELFASYPTYKRFFIDVLGGDTGDPFLNPHFQKHMLQVLLPTLGGVVAHVDSPEAVHEAMKRLGVLHRKKELGLRRENVENLVRVILTTIKRTMEDYTEQQEQALSKILTIVVNMFINGLEGKTG